MLTHASKAGKPWCGTDGTGALTHLWPETDRIDCLLTGLEYEDGNSTGRLIRELLADRLPPSRDPEVIEQWLMT